MILGLHNVPLAVGIGAFVVTLLLGCISIGLRQKESESAGAIGGILGFLMAVALLGGIAYAWVTEAKLDTRDSALEAKLSTAGIQLPVSGYQVWSWDERTSVQKGECVASYTIQTKGDLVNDPAVWPLVKGTGEFVTGKCDPDLDKVFIH